MLTTARQYGIDLPKGLLTVSDVAALLNISERTVYEKKHALGGFYPARIQVLRFRPEDIYGIMEGQDPKGLALRLSMSGAEVCGRRISNKKGSGNRKRRPPEGDQGDSAGRNRHGLFGPVKQVPGPCGEEVRP
jgi:hypothetical protein